MFKRTRRRIVFTVAAALLAFFVGTLGIIYLSSYRELSARNREMLDRYVRTQALEIQPPDLKEPEDRTDRRPNELPPDDREFRTPEMRQALYENATFYAVTFDSDGAVKRVDNGRGTLYSEEELIALASAVRGQASEGRRGNLVYRVHTADDGVLVAFLDDSITRSGMTTLLRNTLIFGAAAVILLSAGAVLLVRRILRPVEESHRKQKQFISDAGHELKTPVSVVGANIEILERENGNNRWLENIRYENERMGALITQLLELSRTEAAAPMTETVDLSRLVTGEALPFESVAFEQGLTLSTDLADGITVCGNPTQLRQLTAILLDNATRHAQGGPAVTVTLRQDHRCALLAVSNAAPDIPPAQLQQLFERFYRVDEARESDSGHYGLGLSIAHAIVAAHRGHIDLASQGGRFTVTVRLPLAK